MRAINGFRGTVTINRQLNKTVITLGDKRVEIIALPDYFRRVKGGNLTKLLQYSKALLLLDYVEDGCYWDKGNPKIQFLDLLMKGNIDLFLYWAYSEKMNNFFKKND